MDKDSDKQLLITQATIEANKKESDEKMKNITEYFKEMITSTIISTMGQMNILKSSPYKKDQPNPEEHNTVVLANRRAPPSDGGNYTKNGGMWTLKHDISSPKFYELLIKTELKGDTDLDPNKFYNHINMCLNAVTRIR